MNLTPPQRMADLLMEVKERCHAARPGQWREIAEWAKRRADELGVGEFTVAIQMGDATVTCFRDWLAGFIWGCSYWQAHQPPSAVPGGQETDA